jgi:hypothetical protein
LELVEWVDEQRNSGYSKRSNQRQTRIIMTLDYHRVWEKMNDLEMVSTKISSAREILDCAVDRLQEHQYDKAETLLYAVDEYLQYYLEEFDRKFKDAWKETVTKVHQQEIDDCMPPWGHSDMEYLACNKDDTSPECKDAWNSFWEEEPKQDKVVKWRLPVEEVENGDTMETEYFITFPDDLLEAANLKPGDEIEWVDRNDGTFILRKPNVIETNS